MKDVQDLVLLKESASMKGIGRTVDMTTIPVYLWRWGDIRGDKF
jgi:hypothetical protein